MTDSSIATGLGGQLLRVLKGLGADNAAQEVFTLADSAGNLLGTSGAPLPVTDASLTSSVGAAADAEATGAGSVIAILKRIRTLLSGTLATSRTWTLGSGTDSVAVSGTVAVTGAYQATQPVSGTVTVSNPTTNPETGLAKDGTDITSPTAMPAGGVGIRGWLSAIWTKLNGSLAVTGTFWQSTQPVSAATLPLPTGAAQDGTDIASPTAMPAGGAGIRGWLSAIWTKLNGSLAVTGTFWQATQPISATALPLPTGAVTNTQVVTSVGAQADTEATADGSVIAVLKRLRTLLNGGLPAALGTGGGLKVDGSGTSLPTTAAQGTAGAVGNAWPVKNTDGTNTAAVKAASTAAAATDPALVVSVSPNSPIPQATLTKGTQGATGLSVQDLKDAGRTRVVIGFQGTATATADTLLSLVKTSAGVAAGGATSIGVTSGKTLRITSLVFSLKANAAAAAFATLTLRSNPSGATLIGSQSELRLDLGNTAATVGAADKVTVEIPDGMEFSGAQTIGASLAAQATTNIISVALIGFEY